MTAKPRTYPRGAVVMANLDPITGSEQGGVRPVVILSNLETIKKSRARPLYVIVPLTRSTTLQGVLAPRIKARDDGIPLDSTVLTMHVRSLDATRINGQVTVLEPFELLPILEGIKTLLEIEV
jgi:mRNA interferase MazF